MKLEVYKQGEIAAYAEVDPVDHLWACQYRWHLTNAGYVTRGQRRGKDFKSVHMYMHREVMGLKHGYPGQLVDHIDGDPLNNTRANLRIVTHAQNCQNRKLPSNNKSGYRGVSWYEPKGQWRVAIMVDGKRTLVGYFDDVHEAGRAAQDFYAENVPHARQALTSTASEPGLRESETPICLQPVRPGGERAIPDSQSTS